MYFFLKNYAWLVSDGSWELSGLYNVSSIFQINKTKPENSVTGHDPNTQVFMA